MRGSGSALSDLSHYPTHLTVDGFMVELTNLTATEEYQVTVSSDSAGRGDRRVRHGVADRDR